MSYLIVQRSCEEIVKDQTLIYSDSIQLIVDDADRNQNKGLVIYQQPCDSIADRYITYKWSKAGGNPKAYTLKPGVYKIKPSKYKGGNAMTILRPETILGFRDFTLPHKIHTSGFAESQKMYETIAKDKKKYNIGPSGGCIIVSSIRDYGILDACFYYEKYNIEFPAYLQIINKHR